MSNKDQHTKGWYSAYLQLVGVQDLAEEDEEAFTFKSKHLRFQLAQCAEQDAHKDAGIECLPWLTECYIQCKDLRRLVVFVDEMRHRLMTPMERVFVRGYLSGGQAFESNAERVAGKEAKGGAAKKGQGASLNTVFNNVAAMLAGQLLGFKAIGIRIDRKIRTELEPTKEEADKFTFENCYVIGDGGRRRVVEYVDLKWQKSEFAIRFDSLLVEMRHALHRSAKSARYYVPLLVNFARHVVPGDTLMAAMKKNLSESHGVHPITFAHVKAWTDKVIGAKQRKKAVEAKVRAQQKIAKEDILTEQETVLAKLGDVAIEYFTSIGEKDNLSVMKSMPGGVFVYLVLVDRYFLYEREVNKQEVKGQEKMTIDDRCRAWVVMSLFDRLYSNWVFRAKWLQEALDKSNPLGWPPEQILSPFSRGKMRKEVAKFVEPVEGEKEKAGKSHD